MKYSRMYIPTLKENILEKEPLNYRLLNKAGYIRKNAAGVYALLPLGAKALGKFQTLIASRLEDRNCFEIIPASIQDMDNLIRQTAAGRMSYKELPIGVWFAREQRSEHIRPRLGLMHPRIWQSLQGFKLVQDEEELNTEVEYFRKAFQEIIYTLKIDCVEVEMLSEHFLGQKNLIYFWPYSSGEDSIIRCKKCGKLTTPDSISCPPKHQPSAANEELKIVYTPGIKTIQDLANFLDIKEAEIVKTLIYKADDRLIGVLIRGDRELSEIKLKTVLKCSNLVQANAEEVYQATGAEVGFAGPIGLKADIICDYEAAAMTAAVVGANKTDNHYINVVIGREFKADIITDVRCAETSDFCAECGGNVELISGFTLAKLNKRGLAYAEKHCLTFINSNGSDDFIYITDFEFNLYRLLAAAAESNYDEAGLRISKEIAPFDIVVMPVHADNEPQASAARKLYTQLQEKGFDVLLDDRKDRVSLKFKDAELIGIPLSITVGRKIVDGILEVKSRTGDMQEVHFDDIISYITSNEVDYAIET